MFETALPVGSAFGVRHAFEADHLAAIATLVEDGNRSASTGAAWGVGHSIPILVLGVSFLSLDVQIPSTVTAGFEALVAVSSWR
jgi:high-affinity nickel permease